jgi:hypothetical protein
VLGSHLSAVELSYRVSRRARMDLNSREFWALVHGILLGGGLLVAFSGGLAGFTACAGST